MTAILSLSVIATVMAVQGAPVFGTAWLALRLLKTSHGVLKVLVMGVSHVAWISFTVGGYVMTGGDLGMMDGGGLLFILCVSALAGSAAYTLGWILWPPLMKLAGATFVPD